MRHSILFFAVIALAPRLVTAQDWPDFASPVRAVGGGENDAGLIVAIERYSNVPGIQGAKANGLAWFDYLVRTRKTPVDRVHMLFNDAATRERMLKEASWVASSVRKGGQVWFIFIGHGAPVHNGKEPAFLGYDVQQAVDSLEARGVTLSEVSSRLQSSEASRIVIISDACFSGRLPDGASIVKNLQPLVVTQVSPLADPRFLVLTAAKGDQFAGPLPGLGRPAFSYLLLGALRGWADKDKDGNVTASEALDFTAMVIKTLVRDREQDPDLLGDEGFVLGKSPGEPGPDLAGLARRQAQGDNTFRVTELAPLPTVTVPKALETSVGAMDFRNVDVETMEQYDRVVRLDESKPRRGEEEELAMKKAQAWKELAQRAPSLREQALRRASEWEEHARQLRALKEARIARTKARDSDWAKLSRLLPLRVIPEESKRKWASDFVQTYGTTFADNPYCAELRAYLGRGVSCEETPPGFVRIPAGRFQMGSPDSEPGRYDREFPVHEVTIHQPFFLKATEVTQGEWKALMGNNPSRFKNCGDFCPVEQVSWWDAVAFCNALSRKEGLEECYSLTGCRGTPGEGDFECTSVTFAGLSCTGYRLPTEAEWEYAARAGTTTALYTGGITLRAVNNAPELDPIAWYGGNSGVNYEGGWDCSWWTEKQYSSSRCGPHPVAKKQPNAWGLYDMLGNVYEWVQDWYRDSYNGAPSDGSAWESPAGSDRVIRGGSWVDIARDVRAAARGWTDPGVRSDILGFRPARSIP